MRAMTFKDSIILRRRGQANGHSSERPTEAQTRVRAAVSVPGLSFRSRAEAAGYGADLVAHLWRSEFEGKGYNFAEVNGVEYRISSTCASVNDLYVKLVLESAGALSSKL